MHADMVLQPTGTGTRKIVRADEQLDFASVSLCKDQKRCLDACRKNAAKKAVLYLFADDVVGGMIQA
jgi:hypothetical protein